MIRVRLAGVEISFESGFSSRIRNIGSVSTHIPPCILQTPEFTTANSKTNESTNFKKKIKSILLR